MHVHRWSVYEVTAPDDHLERNYTDSLSMCAAQTNVLVDHKKRLRSINYATMDILMEVERHVGRERARKPKEN